MADDPINELVDVIDLPPLPKLPEPFGAVEMADGTEAPVYSADQMRQAQREAVAPYERKVRAFHGIFNAAPDEWSAILAEKSVTGDSVDTPEGWKQVPVEPTGEQLRVALTFDASGCQMGEIYRAMLAAAPQPPKENS